MRAGAASLHARAHPRAIVAVWVWQGAIAAVAAWPAASLVRTALGSDPRGDAPLWEPGGVALLDLVWHNIGAFTAAVDGALLVGIGATAAGWVALGALMSAIERPHDRAALSHAVYGTLRVLPTFFRCAVVIAALQGATLAAGVFLAKLAEGWTAARLGEAPSLAIAIAVGLPFGLAALGLGVAHDVVRAVVVVRGAKAIEGLVEGFRLYRSSFATLSVAWAWRSVASLGPVAASAWLAGRLAGGAWAVATIAAAHQATALSRVALRASWLARAMRDARQAAVRDR